MKATRGNSSLTEHEECWDWWRVAGREHWDQWRVAGRKHWDE